MKSQALTLPNGMIGHVFATSIAHNDKGVMNISGIEEHLKELWDDYWIGVLELLPAIYVDAIYQESEVVVKKGNRSGRYFAKMSRMRQKIEHHFAALTNLFSILQRKLKFKIGQLRGWIAKKIICYWFMLNVHTCVRGGNTVLKTMDMKAPTLEEYLGGEIHGYAGEIETPDNIPLAWNW